MSTTVAASITTAFATSLIKKTLDDIYQNLKDKSINFLGRARSDVEDAAIARSLNNITKVKTLWNVEKEVSLYDFYYPSRIRFSNEKSKNINKLRDLGVVQNFVIQGTAGQGKSIFLRYLCGQELISEFTSNRVPLFVELRRIRSDLNVKDLILEALNKYQLPHTENAWNYFAESGKFVLLMDAFDEIDPALVSQAVADIEHLSDLFTNKLQIIITSRPEADIQRSSRFRVCKLAPLDDDDHYPFLRKICAEESQADSLFKVISSSNTEIRGLLTTPLMMTLLVILYKSIQTVPDTVPKFYEELFDVLFYRHDNSKPGFRRKRYTKLDDSNIKKLFSAFCFYVRLERLGVLTSKAFKLCLDRAAKACNESIEFEKFKDELTKTVCLMQQDGFEYSFIHRSVTQYYAASFVSNSSEKFAKSFYQLASKPGTNWDLELRFLSQIDQYHYAKHYEIPLLHRVAEVLNYSFINYDCSAESRLHEYMLLHISLIFDISFESKKRSSIQKNESKSIIGWSRKPSKNEILLDDLSFTWVRHILNAASEDQIFNGKLREIYINGKKEREKGSNHPSSVSCKDLQNEIDEKLPNLGKIVIAQLQKRYDDATTIIKIEDEKTTMIEELI